MAYPNVALGDIDDDSRVDLFYTVQYEEFIFGRLLLGGPHEAREAFRSSERACRVPELRDVTGDGQFEILDYEAVSLDPEECTGDPIATICQERFPTEWIQVYQLQADGAFRPDSLGARHFYREMADRYRAASAELAEALAIDRSLIGSPRCDEAMVAYLAEMAERARAIAGMPGML